MEPVTITWEWDAKKHARGQAVVNRTANRRARRWTFAIMFVIVASVGVLPALGAVSKRTGAIIAILFLVVFLALVIVGFVARMFGGRRMASRSERGQGETEVTLDATGFHVVNGQIRTELGWSEFRGAFYEGGFFVFLLRDGGGCFVPVAADDPRWETARAAIPGDLWREPTPEPKWR